MLAKAKSQDDQKRGERIIVIGLLTQVAFFGFFIVVSALFHYRISLYPTARSRRIHVPWQRYLWILYTASALIMVRSIYRLLEYIQGKEGVLQSKEAYIYILDATLMFVVAGIFNVFHPSQIINTVSMSSEMYDMGADDTEYMVETRK
ncbi:RTA-like protein [Macrophomina phaseolina MS6]|uniref:RTA-like protein n=1 Tax=Macrophomina phaseolina (strain MS6) TaxID=1126212 RepID=K2RJT8_MACPH|nr:RTA-like protein [Macrophomina phaseolina MS6]